MDASRKHIRGSSVLLGGRVLSVLINFAGQVLIVRYLTTKEYGIWAYALAAVSVFGTFSTLAFDKAIDRFVPICHEKKQYGKVLGTIVFVTGVIVAASCAVVAGMHLFRGPLGSVIPQDGTWSVLVILILLVPFEALNILLVALFASFGSTRTIFFRKYLLGPSLKLVAVVLLVGFNADLRFLAYGFLAASALGVLICLWMLVQILRQNGLLQREHLRNLEFPVREIVLFAAPLMSSEMVGMLLTSSGALLLGYFHNPEQVAIFRVVLPIAALNQLVRFSFTHLFTPQASRMFANGDIEGIRQLYSRSTIWTAALTFPIFAVTFGASKSLVVFLYGERYAESGVILALMALGTYFQAMLGLSHLTLKAFGQVKTIVMVDMCTIFTFLLLNLALIPVYGAFGAAVATATSLIAHNTYRQIALHLKTGVTVICRDNLTFYGSLAGGIVLLGLIVASDITNIYLSGFLAGLTALLFLLVTRHHLQIEQTFPELRRFLRIYKEA